MQMIFMNCLANMYGVGLDMKLVIKRILQVAGVAAAAILAVFLILLIWLTVTEYKPEEIEKLVVDGNANKTVQSGELVSVMTWNIGYGALGDNADFFMDGGTMVHTADEDRINENMAAINTEISSLNPDVVFLQEVDIDSKRSSYINEQRLICDAQSGYCNTFANNYKVSYVPYPMPTIGKVDCGLLTLSGYQVADAERISLPCPFSYPIRIANLKRCLMVDRIPVEGSDKELVLVNLHLEAYDDGEGKAEQTRVLKEFLQKEVDAGNYVIAAGDFNQVFAGVDTSAYPIIRDDLWKPGEIDTASFGDDLSFQTDNSIPSCRSLDQPYEGADIENFQYYLIDGFIVSSNISVESVETQDLGFRNADHNPIFMKVKLN